MSYPLPIPPENKKSIFSNFLEAIEKKYNPEMS